MNVRTVYVKYYWYVFFILRLLFVLKTAYYSFAFYAVSVLKISVNFVSQQTHHFD